VTAAAASGGGYAFDVSVSFNLSLFENDSLCHCGCLREAIKPSIHQLQDSQGTFSSWVTVFRLLMIFLFSTAHNSRRLCIRHAGKHHDNRHLGVVFVSFIPTKLLEVKIIKFACCIRVCS
jgi:hypothetical protein